MKIITLLIAFIFSVNIMGQINIDIINFMDTIYFDSNGGNYIVKYLGNSSIGYSDTIITFEFEPPTKIEPSITGNVNFIADSSYYLYSYKIANGPNAEQDIIWFYLFFKEDIEIKNKQTNNYDGGEYNDLDLRIGWWGNGLEPTWSADGFAISSKHLPSIGQAGMRGGVGMLSYRHGMPSSEIEDTLHSLSIGDASFKKIQTIVPIKLPAQFDILEFIDTLLTYCDRSYSLSWIESEGILKSLKVKLENAKKHLINSETEEAIDLLNAFINEVEAQNGKKLTSEAYALLKFNTEYLIEQIKKE
ncbi:MAG: hypothetical protein ABFS12_01350 [Bacteroidota bacterium]